MPDLDVSEVLASTMLADDLVVYRRTQTMNGFGRADIATAARFNTYGVVTPSSPDDLERGDTQQNMRRTLSISTPFRLRGPSPGYQPDLVRYRGAMFIITNVGDYSPFGEGFIVATAQGIDSVDPPPEE